MTIEAPRSRPHARPRISPRFATVDALKSLPPRRPVADPPVGIGDPNATWWELVNVNRYRVRTAEGTKGFIDVVGAVYVVLAGPRYSRAVEVAQTLVFEAAVELLGASDERG